MLRKLLVIQLVSSLALADCPNAIRLRPGQSNDQCERVGYSAEYDKQVVSDLVRGEYNERLLKEQERQLGIKDLTIQAYEKKDGASSAEITRLRTRADELENRGRTEFWVGLGVGILTILASSWALKNVAR